MRYDFGGDGSQALLDLTTSQLLVNATDGVVYASLTASTPLADISVDQRGVTFLDNVSTNDHGVLQKFYGPDDVKQVAVDFGSGERFLIDSTTGRRDALDALPVAVTAQETAEAAIPSVALGQPFGPAQLDGTGRVQWSQLPPEIDAAQLGERLTAVEADADTALALAKAATAPAGDQIDARLGGNSTGLVPRVAANETRLGFDITKIRPTSLTTLGLTRASVMQHAIKDPVSGDFYVTQTVPGTAGGRETACITRCASDGTPLDFMLLEDGGHGTAIALQRVAGKVTIWLAYQAAPSASAVTPGAGNNDLLRFEYKAQTAAWTRDTIVATVMPKFGGAYVIVAIDEANDTIAYRTSGGTSDVYTRRKLSEVLTGVDKTYGTVTLQQGALPDGSTITMQGFASIDDSLYRYTGDTGGATNPARITRYAWADGTVTGVVDTSALGVSPDGTVLGGFREPEGIAIYRDPASGLPHLTAGVTTGPTNRRSYTLFLFAPVGGTEFRGTQLGALERIAPVGKDFRARRIDPAVTSLHALTQPGDYYLTGAEFGAMTDRPAEAVSSAGHFLHVSGLDTNTAQTQTLSRNTIGNPVVTWRRVIDQASPTNASAWTRVPDAATIEGLLPTQLTKGGRRMPAGTTTYQALNTPGWWYLTSAEASTFTDKPSDAPTTSGYYLEVSGYDTGTGYVQRLVRNSAATGAWNWYRVLLGDGTVGAWVRSADATAGGAPAIPAGAKATYTIVHGTNAAMARPTTDTATTVYQWQGSVPPTNMTGDDIWVNTTP